ncbi:MAG: endopeptidase La [Tyzzerella sp.]|nr:endopeptidase La [Tyzzerella sp.]
MERKTVSIPMVALRGMVVMPEMVIHFDVSRPRSKEAIQRVMQSKEQKVFLVAQRELSIEEPEQKDVYEVGTIAVVKQVAKMNKNILRVLITGVERARLVRIESFEPYMQAELEILEDHNDFEPEKLSECPEAKSLQEIFFEYSLKSGKVAKDVVTQVADAGTFKSLVNKTAASVPLDYMNLQDILEEDDLYRRCSLLSFKLTNEIAVQSLKDDIQQKVKERMDKHQKEYILREQLKVIREELGEENTVSDAEEFEQAARELTASKEVKEKLMKEIKRFKSAAQSPAENGVIRTYIETMLEMPWDKVTQDNEDLAAAKQILEDEHYGLEKVKERILEFLAVRTLTHKGESPILCLVGPPGTGKTSIAKSLAKALQKPYARISLGGVRDEAEIRGHRKTYVGAMPGRIANALKSTGVKNPLLLLDEIDKVSNDYKGDTFSALLEVLDGEQNVKFRDHYLEVPIDLSEVLFVTTANSLQTIPRPLLDRMEVIEVNSYTENEKMHIAARHLIPKQLAKHGLNDEQLKISKGAVWKMSRNYTKEAGVRQLERTIGEICRKAAREILEDGRTEIRVTERNLEKYLGKEKFQYSSINDSDEIGIVRGLAWTSVGGDTLEIEVNIMPGKGEITLTGQLGDVMKESAKTGISYIRSVGNKYQIPKDFFEKHDIHIHIPEGAVPKDGPSAGITMATAMISAITEKKVRADVAMTGEITLRGRILPIGGLKEKLLAAKSAGVRTVLVPEKNMRDVEEITSEITRGLEIIPVSYMEEVLKAALVQEEGKNED